ncbi:MAG: nitroreductase [Firmicutes bacterium]|nr:nitroreductase [Bacillota bacterium]
MLREVADWRSIRKFDAKPVTEEQLITILEAGRRAPSWKNIQPWKFIAITKDEDKLKLAEVFAFGSLIKKAPAVILCTALLDAWGKNNQRGRLQELLSHTGFNMSEADIDKIYLDTELAQALAVKPSSLMARTFENMGIAYGFMLLEAMNQGLGACILGELDNELVAVNNSKYNEIKRFFGLNESQVITAAIILGVPAKETSVNPRKPADETYVLR